MIDLLIQILIAGISTAAFCRTVVYYEGPFYIFPRLKWALLPHIDDEVEMLIDPFTTLKELEDHYAELVILDQEIDGKKELWKSYHTIYNPKFYRSFRGTLYNMLDCPFCLGPYVSILMAILLAIYQLLTHSYVNYSVLILQTIIIALGSYGIHFIISKRWEQHVS